MTPNQTQTITRVTSNNLDTTNLAGMNFQTLKAAFSKAKSPRQQSWTVILQKVIGIINKGRRRKHHSNNPFWAWVLDWFRDLYIPHFNNLSRSQQGRILSKWIIVSFADTFISTNQQSLQIYFAIREYGKDYADLKKKHKLKINTLLCAHLRKYFWPGRNSNRNIYITFKEAVRIYMNQPRYHAIFFNTIQTMRSIKDQLFVAGDWANVSKIELAISIVSQDNFTDLQPTNKSQVKQRPLISVPKPKKKTIKTTKKKFNGFNKSSKDTQNTPSFKIQKISNATKNILKKEAQSSGYTKLATDYDDTEQVNGDFDSYYSDSDSDGGFGAYPYDQDYQ